MFWTGRPLNCFGLLFRVLIYYGSVWCYVQLSRFLSDLSRVLHMDTEMLSVDTESAMEALLGHVGRLVSNESTSIADCRTHIRGLQRKLKGNKELLDSRVLYTAALSLHR